MSGVAPLSGARLCTKLEAYELAYAIRQDESKPAEGDHRAGQIPGEFELGRGWVVRVEDLRPDRPKRWWEFWK